MTDPKTYETNTEAVTSTLPFGDTGDERETLKGRCTTCWAGIIMRSNVDHECVEITCRGCGKSLVGKAAEHELDRMWQEQGDHSLRLLGRSKLAYDRKSPGPFVWKIVPPLQRETDAEFKARISSCSQTKAPAGYLGRGRFPPGSPGLLYLQAKILSDGLDSVPGFDAGAIGGFPHTERNEDGSLSVYYSREELEGGPPYREHRKSPGPFVWKIVPPLQRETDAEFKARISSCSQTKAPAGYLGRGRFPPGSPGLLYLQAKILSDGLDSVPGFDAGAIGGFPHTERNEDGSLSVYYSREELEGGPPYREHRLIKMMGANMVASMSSAFACELAIKAICLTYNGRSLKSHKLYDLYGNLPDESRARVEFDYPELPDVLQEGRERFGEWRYFESVIGEPALLALTSPALSRSLLKAARVLLDEGAVTGLTGGIKMEARQSVRVVNEDRFAKYSYNLMVNGGEAPTPRPK